MHCPQLSPKTKSLPFENPRYSACSHAFKLNHASSHPYPLDLLSLNAKSILSHLNQRSMYQSQAHHYNKQFESLRDPTCKSSFLAQATVQTCSGVMLCSATRSQALPAHLPPPGSRQGRERAWMTVKDIQRARLQAGGGVHYSHPHCFGSTKLQGSLGNVA